MDSQAWIFLKIFLTPARKGWGRRGSAPDGGQQHLRDVHDLDALGCGAGGLLGRQGVGQHHPAERAGDGNLFGTGGHRLLGAVAVDPGAKLLLHSQSGATDTAAEREVAVPRHLRERDPRQRADQLLGRVVNAVVPADLARVVARHRRAHAGAVLRRGRHRSQADPLPLLDGASWAPDELRTVTQALEAQATAFDEARALLGS